MRSLGWQEASVEDDGQGESRGPECTLPTVLANGHHDTALRSTWTVIVHPWQIL